MENMLLTDPGIFPDAEVLEKALDRRYPLFEEFMSTLESAEYKLKPEWRFYKDGKAWLCKITLKKKTVVWLSVWPDCFKLGFYFTEKTGSGITALNIEESIKEFYVNHEAIGKLKPLVIELRKKAQLADTFTLIKYKIDQL